MCLFGQTRRREWRKRQNKREGRKGRGEPRCGRRKRERGKDHRYGLTQKDAREGDMRS